MNVKGESTIILKIKSLYPDLKPSEKRVADYILTNRESFIYSNLTSASKAAGVSEATFVRFSKTLGYEGYRDMHIAMAVSNESPSQADLEEGIEDLSVEVLKDCPLQNTTETIPLFQDVLTLFEGGAPLVVELKAERGNAAALTDAAMALLKDWQGTYCVESFHPGVLLRLKARYPEVIRGQLSQNFLRDSEVGGLSLPVRFVLTHLLTTAFTRPDFIAYNCLDRRNVSLRLMKKLYGVHEAAWTVRDRNVMEQLEAEGVPVIFEKFVP